MSVYIAGVLWNSEYVYAEKVYVDYFSYGVGEILMML